jgi:hypothetical protein
MSYADVAASGPKQSAEEVSTCAYEDEDDAVFANMRTGVSDSRRCSLQAQH